MVEDSQRGLRPRVSNGVQPLAPGPSHTLSDRKEMVMCPGPLPLASGVYLIGGTESSRTSEKVKLDGSVEEGFGLKYDIRLKSGIELIYLHKDIFTFFASFSCAIPDPFKEEVMITGGRGTTNQVSINNNNNNNRVYYLNNKSYHRQSLLVTETFVNFLKLSC